MDEQPIGTARFRDFDHISRSATMGLVIGEKKHWNQEYGVDTINTIVQFLFNSHNLHRVQADTWSGNERSIRAFEKCGFHIDGKLHENYWVNGRYYDTIILGLLHFDWKQRHTGD